MNELVLAILGSSVITALITFLFTRQKTKAETKKTTAEAASEQVDASSKVSDLLKDMQIQNVELYRKNTELEKGTTDRTRTIEILTARLESRDAQVATANRQLDLLRSLAEQAPITETLRVQLEGMNKIIDNLQQAQSQANNMMKEKDKIMATLFETNRNLELKKPPKE